MKGKERSAIANYRESEVSGMQLVNTMITFVPFVGLDNCLLLMGSKENF